MCCAAWRGMSRCRSLCAGRWCLAVGKVPHSVLTCNGSMGLVGVLLSTIYYKHFCLLWLAAAVAGSLPSQHVPDCTSFFAEAWPGPLLGALQHARPCILEYPAPPPLSAAAVV